MDHRFKKALSCLVCWGGIASAPLAWAGFLEMPDTAEVPEMERKSLLKDLDIPAVRDRDPDPMAGPRLNISEFRVQGIVEYPELGITRESLTKLVEGIRFDLMGEGEMLESGYTLDEVSEISDLIAQIEEETEDTHVTPLDLQRLVFLIRDQRQKRGVTVGMIEAVADTITRYYRERGFILAKAYIPQQHVRDGVVTLTVLLGNLGEVNVLNNNKYSAKTLKKIFRNNLGRPVKADKIEAQLFFVNDLPGIAAQAYFEPGAQVGDTRLNLNVIKEQSYSSNFRIDNHGSENTGEYRLYGDVFLHNPLGYGDQLHVGLLSTMQPSNSVYGSLHYGFPLFTERAKFTLGGSTNDFISRSLTRNGQATITGTSTVFDASLNYILTRSRAKNYSFEVRMNQINSNLENDSLKSQELATPIDLDTKIRNLDVVFNFDLLLEKIRGLHQGAVRITVAEIVEGKKTNQKVNPLILSANYSFLKFMKVPFTNSQSRVVFKFSGQYVEDSVPGTSQFSLTGPYKMRGMPINQYSSDRGVYGSVDWVFNGPGFLSGEVSGQKISDTLQPYLFAETAYGDSTPQEGGYGTWGYMSDVGLGLKFSLNNAFRASLSYAKVLDFYYDNDPQSPLGMQDLEDDQKLYFDLQYSF